MHETFSVKRPKFLAATSNVQKFNLKMLNSSEICTGVFTRTNNKNKDEKSVLDYMFISSELEKGAKSLRIDEKKDFTPWRRLKSGKRFSDHNAMILPMNVNKNPSKEEPSRETKWSFGRNANWEKFYQLTNDTSEPADCWENCSSVEIAYQKWSSRLNSIMHKCFKNTESDIIHNCIIKRSDT